MTDRIYALYDNMETAVSAVNELMERGILSNNISVITRDENERYARYVDVDDYDEDDVKGDEGAAFGTVIGALTGLGVALIPGFGPVFAAGPLAAALFTGVGAGAGAITGGVTAALVDFGADEDEVKHYDRVLREGGGLVIVDTYTEAEEDSVEHVLSTYRPMELES